jgi:CheY-like chemotaxis protein
MAKILLIEDTEIIRHSTSAALKHEGFDVIAAKNGIEGLEYALTNHPDIILCDVMMPGMDGYQVLEQLQKKQATRTIPFVFLTGKDAREDIRHCMHLDADDYLTKPFTRTELLQTIQSQLKKRDAIKAHYEEYIQKLETPEENLHQYDSVTTLPNILYLKEKFTFFINHLDNAQIRNPGETFHLPFWVLKIERHDKIKQVLGYEGYNQLLQEIAIRLQTIDTKEEQEFALISDSEFAVLWIPVQTRKESADRAKEIINLFNSSYNVQDKELRQFKSEVQQVLMMTARILHSECDSQAIFLVDY